MLHNDNLYNVLHWLQRVDDGYACEQFSCNRCYLCTSGEVCYNYMPLNGYTTFGIVEGFLDLGYPEYEAASMGALFTMMRDWQRRHHNDNWQNLPVTSRNAEPVQLSFATLAVVILVIAVLAAFPPAW